MRLWNVAAVPEVRGKACPNLSPWNPIRKRRRCCWFFLKKEIHIQTNGQDERNPPCTDSLALIKQNK